MLGERLRGFCENLECWKIWVIADFDFLHGFLDSWFDGVRCGREPEFMKRR